MKPNLTALRIAGVEAATAAGEVLLHYFGKNLNVKEKMGAGLVTNADLEAEQKAVGILKHSFPDFGFLTEEAAPHETSSPGRWIIDPLDGTTNFVHGFPMFCVSIGAEWDGEIILGVIYHPILKDLYVAEKGKGATVNDVPMKVSKTKTLRDSLLTTGFTYRKEDFLDSEIDAFKRLSKKTRAIRRPGSAAMDLAYTARGVFDGFWEQRLSPWDVAAGILLVTEAGGQISNFKGTDYSINDPQLLASNRIIHSELLKEVSKK